MKKMINKTYIEGYLYEHDLTLKVTGPNSKAPGTPFIGGSISIATDNALLNVVKVDFTYVTETTKKGGVNNTYVTLKNIIDGVFGTVMKDGKDRAVKLRVDSAIGLNDFYTESRNNPGELELVSAKRNEGGFVHVVSGELTEDEDSRNTFECDIVITSVAHKEADEERDIPEKAIIKGCTFNFAGAMLPIELSATNPNAIAYFESLDASSSNPTFTKVWGRQISETIVKKINEESAFGDAKVREVKSVRKDFIITGAATEPYVWDEEGFLTAAELKECIAARETHLATVKQRYLEYKQSQSAPAAAAPVTGGFNF
jgi:hypothetical protein